MTHDTRSEGAGKPQDGYGGGRLDDGIDGRGVHTDPTPDPAIPPGQRRGGHGHRHGQPKPHKK